MSTPQPWIRSARFDGAFILAPAVIITAVILLFQGQTESLKDVPPWLWLLLIVGVDASHVYSTIFRTYLDRDELRERHALYILTPLAAWIVGCFLYSLDNLVFWRVLAYLAVFHFIRQQYGFMMIYARKERYAPPYHRLIDKAAIYLSTIYPLIYWHCHRRDFEWFIKDDFFAINAPLLSQIAVVIYAVVLTAYLTKEVIEWRRSGSVNIPKNLLLFGTAFSWFVGIVAFNNDLAFTATNVIAHGIPYMALIWLYGSNQATLQGKKNSYLWAWIGKLFQWKAVPFYLAILAIIAFVEEAFWDGFLWRDHGTLFGFSSVLPAITDTHTLVWLVPLLALPQTTHYILDAFIWRMQTKNTNWKQILFYQPDKAS
jgi:hypothetical protein